MIDYFIDGIPDRILYNQARMQNFVTKESLIDAFDKIRLREQISVNVTHQEKRNGGMTKSTGRRSAENDKSEGSNDKKKTDNRKSCFNCGLPDHLSAVCLSKDLGPKCFLCNEHGHIANKCPKKKKETTGETLAVTCNPRKKYIKTVRIFDKDIEALIDTGSDLTLMCEDEYKRIGSPLLQSIEVRFTGIGSPAYTTLGEFQAEVTIDGHRFQILIRVVADIISKQRLLIETNFLEPRKFHAKKGIIYMEPDDDDDNLLDILQINVLDEVNVSEIDLFHINDDD